MIDHTDNNALNDDMSNLRWSCKALNALNTCDRFRGWSIDNSANPARKFKASVRWLVKAHTLGRFETSEEAGKCYHACKDWLQIAYRKHEYKDKHLVAVWRLIQKMNACKVGTVSSKTDAALRRFEHSMTQLSNYLGL